MTPEPTPEPVVVEPERPAAAPEEAGTELLTEANQDQANLAPSASIRPQPRPARRPQPAAEAPAEPADTTATDDNTADAVAAAVAEATAAAAAQ